VAGAAATRRRDVVDDVPCDHRASSRGRRAPRRPRRGPHVGRARRSETDRSRRQTEDAHASKST
jgi:hypothetical protein